MLSDIMAAAPAMFPMRIAREQLAQFCDDLRDVFNTTEGMEDLRKATGITIRCQANGNKTFWKEEEKKMTPTISECQSQITDRLEYMGNAEALLSKSITHLAGRLESVLRNPEPIAEVKENTAPSSLVLLASQLDTRLKGLLDFNARISDIIDRLEL